jgi:hypothetical protein
MGALARSAAAFVFARLIFAVWSGIKLLSQSRDTLMGSVTGGVGGTPVMRLGVPLLPVTPLAPVTPLIAGTTGMLGGSIGMLGGSIGMLGGSIGMLGGSIGMLGGSIGMLGGSIGMLGVSTGPLGPTISAVIPVDAGGIVGSTTSGVSPVAPCSGVGVELSSGTVALSVTALSYSAVGGPQGPLQEW